MQKAVLVLLLASFTALVSGQGFIPNQQYCVRFNEVCVPGDFYNSCCPGLQCTSNPSLKGVYYTCSFVYQQQQQQQWIYRTK